VPEGGQCERRADHHTAVMSHNPQRTPTIAMAHAMSESLYERAVARAGMSLRGGNLISVASADPESDEEGTGTVAWADDGMGLFVLDARQSHSVDMEAIALRDVIACAVVLDNHQADTQFAIGEQRFQSQASHMTLAFVPAGERFQFATRTSSGMKAVTLMVDLLSVLKTHGLTAESLPKTLLDTLQTRDIRVDQLIPGQFGAIATGMVSKRTLPPSAAPLYYKSKALELICVLLSQLTQQEAARSAQQILDPRTLERLREVKSLIDRSPQRTLDIDVLARAAAMNRTKLRSTFKQAYGLTLAEYRTSRRLEDADAALRTLRVSVKQAARQAGYASFSSFIVAYKRRFGIRPGDVLRRGD